MQDRFSRFALVMLLGLLALAAFFVHYPGEASFDTSIQLLEANTGVSHSWNPPFMSALLQWFGGGKQSLWVFILACSLLTYGGMALALPPIDKHSSRRWLRLAASVVVIVNPTIVFYVGIVWKDVLFASLLSFACGASIAATRQSRVESRFALAVIAGFALVLAGHARQQGLLLLPLLVLCPLWAAARYRRPALWLTVLWLASMAAAFSAVGHWTDTRITHDEGRDRSTGLNNILSYDIVGTLAMRGDPLVDPETREVFPAAAIADAYSPARIDSLSRQPALAAYLRGLAAQPTRLRGLWRTTVFSAPAAYARHRLAVALQILGFRDLNACLPIHVGIDGDPVALAAVGVKSGSDQRDNSLYRMSLALHDTPWFRHYATLFGLVVLVIAAWRMRAIPAARVALWFGLAMGVHLVATSMLAIACDFRYLYPVIPVVSACALALIWANNSQQQDSTEILPTRRLER